MNSLLTRIAETIEPGVLVTDQRDIEPHVIEARHLYRGNAIGLVKPRSTQELAAIVKMANEAATPIVVHGGNTGLTGGGVPFGALIISTERLARIRQVDVLNGALVAEAGCILADVQNAAASTGMLFPLSLGAEGSCRIGGNVSTNAGGINVLRYGNMRDLVLGLEVVLADGRIWNGLQALRKDNAGYDLKQLFIGSEGTLGIVTAACLKLYPKPASHALAFVGARTPQAVLSFFELVRQNCSTRLSAFELMPKFGLELVLKHTSGAARPLSAEHEWLAIVELTSTKPDDRLEDELETVLADAFERDLIQDATIAASESQRLAIWMLREALAEVQIREGGSIKHDISVPLSHVAAFIQEATALCESAMPGVRVCAFGHVGDGNVHFNISQPVGSDRTEFMSQWKQFNAIVHDKVLQMNGSIAAEHGVGLMKRDELEHYKDPVSIDLMKTLKHALDPHNLLNPGKVLRIGRDLPMSVPT